ncbi:ATP-dependent DNA helicase HMI1 mitochondrial precursor [Scheffersomyces coipomensis]|uniref:ATP-dependent DNA helicase HMI1 mitochondrial precursor n=1 Tax=Scheffersomyces coipomensis TaxID=1788519 RepID=UPI00315D3683
MVASGTDSDVGTVTDSQRKIIETVPKPREILLVKAGPGSGKTLTMARRIVHLVEQHNIKPEEILVLSMTNRAVGMLKSTLCSISHEESANQINISTFHSFCSRLLEEYGPPYDDAYTKIRLLDDMSWRSFSTIFSAKSISLGGATINGNLTAAKLDKLLSSIKVGELTITEAAQKSNVSEEYLKELIHYLDRNGMKRYSDFITDAIKLMNTSLKGDSSKWIHELANYKIIIVDEFQDMHNSLLKIVKRVVSYPCYDGTTKHLTIAGDPNQCIYEFLGSNPDLFNDIHKEFPDFSLNEQHIHETFRLTPEVLKVSAEVILKPNGLLTEIHKEIKSVKPDGGKPVLYARDTPLEEYDFIASEISRLILQSGGLFSFSDFTILLRSNKEVNDVADHLNEYYGIKCNKLGQSTNWVTSKVHLFLDILNLISEKYGSEFCLMCILMIMDDKPMAKGRISKLFNALQTIDNSEPKYLMNYILQDLKDPKEKNKGSDSNGIFSSIYKLPDHSLTTSYLTKFLEGISKERELLSHNQNPQLIMESLLRIVSSGNLLEHLNTPTSYSLSPSKSSKIDMIENHRSNLDINISSFYNSLISSHKTYLAGNTEKDFISHFLRTYSEDVPVFRSDMVNVSTVHTAKGLEFPVVFIPGSNNHYIADWSSLFQDDNIKIDPVKARLFYVACTRTKHFLYVGSRDRLKSLSSSMNEFFTESLPDLTSPDSHHKSILSNLSLELDRKLPSTQKISLGTSLYSKFYQNSKVVPNTTQVAFARELHINRQLVCSGAMLLHSGRKLFHHVTKL